VIDVQGEERLCRGEDVETSRGRRRSWFSDHVPGGVVQWAVGAALWTLRASSTG
jgi:hypothetical protein